MKRLIEKGESFISRLRWKLFFIQNPSNDGENKENFGFNSTKSAPSIKELKQFEEDFFHMLKNIEFRPIHSEFQQKLNNDIKEIHKSNEVFVSADKSSNKYQMPVQTYKKLVKDNTTCLYKKDSEDAILTTNKEAKEIATKLNLEDRIDQFSTSEAFITIKDHKEGFPSKVQARLINPAKSNIGKISKQILSNIISEIQKATKSNQWRNTNQVIDWFNKLENKPSLSFLKFDIVSFYPSINKQLFVNAVEWATTFTTISKEDLEIITHSRESYLFFNGDPWSKNSKENFDVTMGAYDGAEVCELVGLYILSKVETHINKEHIGLYRDDGLAVVNLPGPQIEKLRKTLFQLFKSLGLSITITANIRATEFLDVWMDLRTGEHRPYRKENSIPLYVHSESNHPPAVKKQLPRMINQRISNLSCSETVFNSNKNQYQEALKNAGYNQEMKYEKKNDNKQKKKSRSRNIIWFNPPYSQSVKTNIGAKFLNLIDKHFKKSEMQKYFNRKTVKISYSCMPNIESIISGHNRKLLQSTPAKDTQMKTCSCRGGTTNCPLSGYCLTKSIIYKAEVIDEEEQTSTYIGLASNDFKERYNNHMNSFKHQKLKDSTALSAHIWNLKGQNKMFSVKWSILATAKAYDQNSRTCHLCLMEKTFILTSTDKNPLNKRSELLGKCRHRRKFLLQSLVS